MAELTWHVHTKPPTDCAHVRDECCRECCEPEYVTTEQED